MLKIGLSAIVGLGAGIALARLALPSLAVSSDGTPCFRPQRTGPARPPAPGPCCPRGRG